MTVAELIAELQKLPPDLLVYGSNNEVESVRLDRFVLHDEYHVALNEYGM